MKQRTIARSFSFSGIGLHSGGKTEIYLAPAPPNSGIVFLKEGIKIPALLASVRETKRGTSLNGISVVEHFLASLYALGIDNLEVEARGDELPALDGSALPYTEALYANGWIEQNEIKRPFSLPSPIKIIDGESSIEALPSRRLKIDFMVDFPAIGRQRLAFDLEKDNFRKDIAPARTFGYIEEYGWLKEQGLAKGASLENALVLGKDGYINAPRFPDEVVRHKILDMLGDLSLFGRPILADISAIKSSHRLNIEFVGALHKMALEQ